MYPLENMTGSCKCRGKSCAVCLNVKETSTFTSSVTHETYKINYKFGCNSKCLIYLLTCKQYVGQTIDDFRFRCNNYKDNNRKYQRFETCMQEHLFKHFSSPSPNGLFNDASTTFIDKKDPSTPIKREDY